MYIKFINYIVLFLLFDFNKIRKYFIFIKMTNYLIIRQMKMSFDELFMFNFISGFIKLKITWNENFNFYTFRNRDLREKKCESYY